MIYAFSKTFDSIHTESERKSRKALWDSHSQSFRKPRESLWTGKGEWKQVREKNNSATPGNLGPCSLEFNINEMISLEYQFKAALNSG